MAADEAGICNLAIGFLRSQNFIETLDETSQEAITCKVFYADTRDDVLSRADWPFARKRVALVSTGTPPDEWDYQYALPSDCLVARAIADGARQRTLDERCPYAIENDGTGDNRVLLTTQSAATLIYTMRVTNAVMYPPQFVKALARLLAANIGLPLDKDVALCQSNLQIAEALIGRAAAAALNENKSEAAPKTDLLTSRLY